MVISKQGKKEYSICDWLQLENRLTKEMARTTVRGQHLQGLWTWASFQPLHVIASPQEKHECYCEDEMNSYIESVFKKSSTYKGCLSLLIILCM